MLKLHPLNRTMVVMLAALSGCLTSEEGPRNVLELAPDSGDMTDTEADRPGGPPAPTAMPPGGSSGDGDDGASSPGFDATTGDEGLDGSTSGGIDPSDSVGDSSDTDDSSDTGGPPAVSPLLIDNLEDGNARILEHEGRTGSWYTFNDGTPGASQIPAAGGPFTPADGGVDGSSYAAAFVATGFTAWGAGMGLELNKPAGMSVQPYDGSNHSGLRFSARGTGTVRLKLQTFATVSVMHGGTCTEVCEDSHGAPIELGDEWAVYTLAFDDATQQGWGTPVALDETELLGVQFLASPDTDVEVVIDNIEFF